MGNWWQTNNLSVKETTRSSTGNKERWGIFFQESTFTTQMYYLNTMTTFTVHNENTTYRFICLHIYIPQQNYLSLNISRHMFGVGKLHKGQNKQTNNKSNKIMIRNISVVFYRKMGSLCRLLVGTTWHHHSSLPSTAYSLLQNKGENRK